MCHVSRDGMGPDVTCGKLDVISVKLEANFIHGISHGRKMEG